MAALIFGTSSGLIGVLVIDVPVIDVLVIDVHVIVHDLEEVHNLTGVLHYDGLDQIQHSILVVHI